MSREFFDHNMHEWIVPVIQVCEWVVVDVVVVVLVVVVLVFLLHFVLVFLVFLVFLVLFVLVLVRNLLCSFPSLTDFNRDIFRSSQFICELNAH